MARIRTIKPQFFLNEELAELSAMTRLLFVGLWTQADRDGRLLDRPKRLKAEIFPYDNCDVEKGLNELHKAGFIIRYKVDVNASGRVSAPEQPITELALIQVVNFSKHQKIDKANEKASELPPPDELDYHKTSDSLVLAGEGKGKEGNGKGKEGDAQALAYPFDSKKFKDSWELWKIYKDKEFKFKYKSILTEQAALNELKKISKNSEQAAINIIHKSIANSWKGFFELKNEQNGRFKTGQPRSVVPENGIPFGKL